MSNANESGQKSTIFGFGALRDKLNHVQEGITASFRGFSESPKSRTQPSSGVEVDYNAGANLLHKYQSEWSELHDMSETNALHAQKLDELIRVIDKGVASQWVAVGQMSATFTAVPKLLNSVQELMGQIGVLQETCDDVEAALARLEDMVETQELQERQLDHRFQLAMYKEKKLAGLEALRSGLVAAHSSKMISHEQRQQQVLRERQNTFGEAFQQDVQQYKESGKVPQKKLATRGPSLEEVALDTSQDSDVLDKFLQEDE